MLYTLVVTNPGQIAFLAPNVNVTDALCEAPPLLVSTNGDTTPGQLDPGDRWTYVCSVQTQVGQTVVDNIGAVAATDSHGNVLQASDPARTQLTQPPVPVTAQGAPVTLVRSTGSARLSGPSRCISGPFTVKVVGRNIASVYFMLDGKKYKTVKRGAGRMVFSVRINPRGQSSRPHRVTARVTYLTSANTRTRTLRYVYLRCAQAAPKFTG